jgi:hypothetical protein
MYFRPKLISNTLKTTAKINVIRNIFDEKYFILFPNVLVALIAVIRAPLIVAPLVLPQEHNLDLDT